MKLSWETSSFLVVVVAWLIISIAVGFKGFYFLVLCGVSVTILEGLLCLFLVSKIAKRVNFVKALPEEIKREDDVLLQGTPFLSAILFFYVNLLFSNIAIKLTLGISIVLFTGTFYVSRALGKVKSNPSFRFESMYFLFFLATSVAYEIAVILFAILVAPLFSLPPIVDVLVVSSMAIIVFLPVVIASLYFPIRYGVPLPKWLKRYFGKRKIEKASDTKT